MRACSFRVRQSSDVAAAVRRRELEYTVRRRLSIQRRLDTWWKCQPMCRRIPAAAPLLIVGGRYVPGMTGDSSSSASAGGSTGRQRKGRRSRD